MPDQIDRNMIAPGNVAVQENTVQGRLADKFDSPLLRQFALQGLAKCFADLDAAARQVPAADIAVLDQKHSIFVIKHDGADAECHAAGKTPIQMKEPPQRRLKTSSQALQCRRHGKPLQVKTLRLILASSPPACQYIHQPCKAVTRRSCGSP